MCLCVMFMQSSACCFVVDKERPIKLHWAIISLKTFVKSHTQSDIENTEEEEIWIDLFVRFRLFVKALREQLWLLSPKESSTDFCSLHKDEKSGIKSYLETNSHRSMITTCVSFVCTAFILITRMRSSQ